MIWVAPTEPLALRTFPTIAGGDERPKVTLAPEQWGVDVVLFAGGKKIGVQRKEVGDLLGSIDDGRLAMQLAQMRSSPLDVRVLVIEGRVAYDGAGRLLKGSGWGREWTAKELMGILWSIEMLDEVVVVRTSDLAETVLWCQVTYAWWKKGIDGHRGLRARGTGGKGAWGKKMSWEWGSWVLQGWPGIGVELADRIIRHFGKLPIGWTVTAEELAEVKGISLKRAKEWVGE